MPAFAETQTSQAISTHKRGGGAAAAYGQRGGEFTGTFAQVWDPFTKSNVTSYSAGTYIDHGTGQHYEGEFSYIPARANGYESGYYLFQGARIDSEADEVIQGLFISDATIPNYGIRFRRARPDYLVKLQEDFQTSQVQATADAEKQKRSRDNMSTLLNVMGGLLSITGGGNLSSLRSSSLSALTSGLTGKGSTSDILQGVVSQIVSRSGADSSLGKVLGGNTDASSVILSLTGLNKSSQPMTKAQYALQMASMLTSKVSPGNDSASTQAAPVGDAAMPANCGGGTDVQLSCAESSRSK
jgi:hypothetical protein